jgi:lysophospholipase L1-like esterase
MYVIADIGARIEHALEWKINRLIYPDIVILALGSNNVTELVKREDIKRGRYLPQTVGYFDILLDSLRDWWPDAKIVVTGAADMGSIQLLPRPLRYFFDRQAKRLNRELKNFADGSVIFFAPVAAHVTAEVRKAPQNFFASDLFHPGPVGAELLADAVVHFIEKFGLIETYAGTV